MSKKIALLKHSLNHVGHMNSYNDAEIFRSIGCTESLSYLSGVPEVLGLLRLNVMTVNTSPMTEI